ncbi:hypothetical protein AB4254_08475 [Vibrio breoganii]
MTKNEMIRALDAGLRVRHSSFSRDEWMEKSGMDGYDYQFEDGCLCTMKEFWLPRTDESWLSGWRIV